MTRSISGILLQTSNVWCGSSLMKNVLIVFPFVLIVHLKFWVSISRVSQMKIPNLPVAFEGVDVYGIVVES